MLRHPLIDRAAVIALYTAGESALTIRDRLGVSVSGVYRVLRETGLPTQKLVKFHPSGYHHWTARQQSEFVRLYAAGHTLADIADRLGKKVTAVASKRFKLGLTRPDGTRRLHAARAKKSCWSEANERSLRQLYHAGYAAARIGKMIGRTEGAVRERVAKLGLKRRRIAWQQQIAQGLAA